MPVVYAAQFVVLRRGGPSRHRVKHSAEHTIALGAFGLLLVTVTAVAIVRPQPFRTEIDKSRLDP